MNFSIFILFSVFSRIIFAQHAIELQFIGDEISPEDQESKNFCESKYCLLDAADLFYAATQNKSVKPCDDFKEFALGTFEKYKAISDRQRKIGFLNGISEAYRLRLRKVLMATVNEKDTRVTKTMKKLYAKCVDTKYVRQNGVNEMRAYLKSHNLNFYPDENRNDFDISKLFEGQPFYSMNFLLQSQLERNETHLALRKRKYPEASVPLYFNSIADLLYEMFEVYKKNSVDNERFTEKFKAIAKQLESFKELQKKHVTNDSEDKGTFMTIDELNNLTFNLNLDWSQIINDQLLTKIDPDEKIYVQSPRTIKNLAKFLATMDKKSIADYFAYNFLYYRSILMVINFDNKWKQRHFGIKKSFERWDHCVRIFQHHLSPALTYLYDLKFGDKNKDAAMKEFLQEALTFAVKKIEAEAQWNDTVKEDLVDRVSAIKVVTNLPDEYFDATKIKELYAHLQLADDQNYVKSMIEIELNHNQVLLEAQQSEIGRLDEWTIPSGYHEFKYSPLVDDVMFIGAKYLHYPFYHNQRPRFFNSAAVGRLLYGTLNKALNNYIKTKYQIYGFYTFINPLQVAYEFYEDWLKPGGEDLELGAHRLSGKQLFWVAAARVFYSKYPTDSTKEKYVNAYFLRDPGFREDFHCDGAEYKD